MRTGRGTTLIELLICTLVFAAVITAVFGVFSLGQSLFQLTTLRHGIQNGARRVFSHLERDVAMSNYATMTLVTDPTRDTTFKGVAVSRQGICMAGIDDWSNVANFDPLTTKPIWNRYIVFYATMADPGRIIRSVIQPPAAITGPVPYATFSAMTQMNDDPTLNANQTNWTILADDVMQATFTGAPATSTLRVSLKLSDTGRTPVANVAHAETFQVDLAVKTRNTYFAY